jgi:hypothetical protein
LRNLVTKMIGETSSNKIDKVFFFSPSSCYVEGELLKLNQDAKPIAAKKTAVDWKDRTDIVIIYVQNNEAKVLNRNIITKLQGYEASKD